ncbi:MAG: hypothetical protein KH334_03440 [Clostridiales bacterium]|nr:hypothetical protein [Clostridiales bacterium]
MENGGESKKNRNNFAIKPGCIKAERKMTKILQKNFFNHIAFLILQAYNMLLQSGAKEGEPWLER